MHVAELQAGVLAMHVADGQDKPYRANGRVYVRVYADVREATREDLARLMVELGRVQYERLPVPEADLAELDHGLVWKQFAELRRVSHAEDTDERAQLLVTLAFATRHAGRVVPTVAGLLLITKERRPVSRRPAACRLIWRCAAQFRLRPPPPVRIPPCNGE